MAVEYRKLVESDLDVFMKMRILQLQEEGAKVTFNLKPYLQDYYMRHLNDSTFISWLAIDEGKIVGTSGMSFVEKPPYYSCPSGKIGLLSSMYVIKEYRRRGIAKILLDKVVQAADLLCTLELVKLKLENNMFSKSESAFLGNARDLKKNYIKPLKKKEWP